MIMNRKTNTVGDSVKWLNIHWIRVEKDCSLSFKYIYTLNDLELWKEVDMHLKRASRPLDMETVEMSPLYCRPRKISANKLKDLKQILCYIPPVHQDFYNALISDDDSVENQVFININIIRPTLHCCLCCSFYILKLYHT